MSIRPYHQAFETYCINASSIRPYSLAFGILIFHSYGDYVLAFVVFDQNRQFFVNVAAIVLWDFVFGPRSVVQYLVLFLVLQPFRWLLCFSCLLMLCDH